MKTTSWVGSYGTGNTRQLVDSYATHQFFVHKIPDDYVAETSRLLREWQPSCELLKSRIAAKRGKGVSSP